MGGQKNWNTYRYNQIKLQPLKNLHQQVELKSEHDNQRFIAGWL